MAHGQQGDDKIIISTKILSLLSQLSDCHMRLRRGDISCHIWVRLFCCVRQLSDLRWSDNSAYSDIGHGSQSAKDGCPVWHNTLLCSFCFFANLESEFLSTGQDGFFSSRTCRPVIYIIHVSTRHMSTCHIHVQQGRQENYQWPPAFRQVLSLIEIWAAKPPYMNHLQVDRTLPLSTLSSN